MIYRSKRPPDGKVIGDEKEIGIENGIGWDRKKH
jgi:hypothetical protein